MEKRPFNELGLSAEVLRAVDKMGFEEASPIQTAVIPPLLEGNDVVGQSATGSGKTAAFAIPAIEAVDPKLKRVQVLILCPTRELAVQVAEEVNKLATFKRGVMEVPVYGGQPYERQIRALKAGAQIVIGTPGRVMDHMERGTLRLDELRMVILDECDRMLDMGFRDDIETVMAGTPEGRQSLFFSATLPPAIRGLIKRYTHEPVEVKIKAHAKNAPRVEQVYFEVQRRAKVEALTRLIDRYDFRHGIVFCSTKIMVDELDEQLHARGYQTDRLHGDISQSQRNRVTEKFKRKGFEFLIATDVAARGLDIDDLEVVFNFDLPNDAEDYTHRIGRTGRAGKSGQAFTFVSNREIYKLQAMIRNGRLKISRGHIPSIDEIEEAREDQFFEKLRTTLETGEYRRQDRLIDRLLEQGFASTDISAALIHIMHGGEKGEAPVEKTPKWAGKGDLRDDRRSEGVDRMHAAKKAAFDRQGRTGREKGFTTLFFNVGRKHAVKPGDIVGKIAGVTRLPAQIVGAIDLKQRHSLVDVSDQYADDVLDKMVGVRLRGVTLQPVPAQGAG